MSIKLPTASTTKDGIVDNNTQTIAGAKTFTGNVQVTSLLANQSFAAPVATRGLNLQNNNNAFIAQLHSTDTSINHFMSTTGSDTGSNPVMRLDVRTGANADIATRPLFDFSNNGSVVGSVSAAGAWTLGGVSNNAGYKQYSLTGVSNLTTSNVLVTSDANFGNWMISADFIDGGAQMFCSFQVMAGIENGVTARFHVVNTTGGNCTISESSEGTFDVTVNGIADVVRFIFGTGGSSINVRTVTGTITTSNFRFHRFF